MSIPPVSAPPITAPVHLPSSSDGGSSSLSSSTSSGQHSTGTGRDTKVFGNLQGRDPDLLFAGEKIMINGKEVTVADGDTLSSLALKHGTTVDKLISENKMDASLLGKNGPSGAYFTPGGPQPAPGGSQTPRPDPLAPAGPNGTYTKEQVPALRAEVDRLQKEGSLAQDKATSLLGLLQKIENGGTLTAKEATDLTGLMKDLKAAQAATSSSTPDPELQKQIDEILKQQGGNTTGILGGGLNGGEDGRANSLLKLINSPKPTTGGLTSDELTTLKDILARAPDKANGAGLEPSEKYLVNKYLLNTRLYNNR